MKSRDTLKNLEAFTLAETMVSLVVSSFILMAVVMATVAFQRTFLATDEYYKATSDQMRVLDFIALDMRRAVSGSVSNKGQTLALSFPDYIDYSQNPPRPRTPVVSANGSVTYGNSAAQPSVVYSVNTTGGKQTIQRAYTPATGAASTTTLTSSVAQFQFLVFNPANPTSTAHFSFGGVSQPRSITAKVSFMPRFTRLNLAASRTGTESFRTLFLRNHR